MSNAITTPKPNNIKSWIVCLSSALFFFYEFMQLSLMDSISAELMATFAISEGQLAYLSALYLFAIVIFYFPVGYLFDRVSVRKLILYGIIIGTLASLVFAVAPNIYIAQIGRFASGFAHCLAFLGCMRIAARWMPEKLGLVMGWNVTIGLLGGVAAHTPFTYFVTVYGWREALIANGLLGIVFFLIIFYNVQDYPEGAKPEKIQKKNPFIHDIKQVLSNAQNWLCSTYTSLLNFPVMCLGALWGTLYLIQESGLSRMQASETMAMIFYGTIVGSPLVGWISEKMQSRKKPMVLGSMLSFILVIVLFTLDNPSFVALKIVYFMLGLVTSIQVITYPILTESNKDVVTGAALSFASMIIMGGGGLAQNLFGYMMEINWRSFWTSNPFTNYQTAFLLIPIAFSISILLSFFVKETYKKTAKNVQPIDSQKENYAL